MVNKEMTILVDTGYFVALANKDDVNHSRADILLEELLRGVYGTRITTDYILDEAITVTWIRTKNKTAVKQVYNYILGENTIVLFQPFQKELITEAWVIFEKYSEENRPLSFTDCTNLAHMKEKDISYILSFDSEFDGLSKRIC